MPSVLIADIARSPLIGRAERIDIAVPRDRLALVALHLGSLVLLASGTVCHGRGTLLRLDAVGVDEPVMATIAELVWTPPVELGEAKGGMGWRLVEIAEDVLPTDAMRPGFAETAQQGFVVEDPARLVADALDAYAHRCAVTGEPISGAMGEIGIHPIRPSIDGGRAAASNFLPLSPRAAAAFEQVQFTIGGDLQIVADLSRIDWALLSRVSETGRLRSGRGVPDPVSLAWHRGLFMQAIG